MTVAELVRLLMDGFPQDADVCFEDFEQGTLDVEGVEVKFLGGRETVVLKG